MVLALYHVEDDFFKDDVALDAGEIDEDGIVDGDTRRCRV